MQPMSVRRKPLAVGFGVLLAALGGACSSSSLDSGAELVSQAEFPERFAQVWCETVAPCCSREQIKYDRATCRAQARDLTAAMLESRVSGDTQYSASAGTLCLDRLERVLQSCELEQASSACSLIFVGPEPAGTACKNGSACQSGYCALGEAGLSGVCAEASYHSPNHGQASEPCVGSCGVPGSFACPSELLPSSEGTASYCYAEDGLYCGFDSNLLDTLVCQPYAAIGAACAEVSCTPGAFCADGTCVAQRASGSCADTPELCGAHSYCDENWQCQAKKPNGAACWSGEECTSSSCSSEGQAEGVCDSGNALLANACAGVH